MMPVCSATAACQLTCGLARIVKQVDGGSSSAVKPAGDKLQGDSGLAQLKRPAAQAGI